MNEILREAANALDDLSRKQGAPAQIAEELRSLNVALEQAKVTSQDRCADCPERRIASEKAATSAVDICLGDTIFDAINTRNVAEDRIYERVCELFDEHVIDDLSFDPYDTSIELYADADIVPTKEQAAAILGMGFSRCWINFKDETQIYFDGEHAISARHKRSYDKYPKHPRRLTPPSGAERGTTSSGPGDAGSLPSSTAATDLEQKLDAVAKALGYPVESWRMAGCDVLAHAITDLIRNYGRLEQRLLKIDATLDQLGAPKDAAPFEGAPYTVALSRRGRIKRLVASATPASSWVAVEKAKADAYADAVRVVEKIAEDYTHEHGSYDGSTNAWELNHRHMEKIEAWDDAVEALRKRKAEKCSVTQAAPACGCRESYPQLVPGELSHGTGCPLSSSSAIAAPTKEHEHPDLFKGSPSAASNEEKK